MFYVEQLRIRNGLIISALIVGTVVVVSAAFSAMCRTCATVDVSNKAMALAAIGYAASLAAGIFAAFYGGSLAYENDDHLPITWTKPISRAKQALGVLGLDLIAIAACFVLVYAAGWLVTLILSGHAISMPLDAHSLLKTARFFAFPLAMFGFAQAFSATLRGAKVGLVIGPMWPVLEGLFGLTLLPLSAPWNTILKVMNLANPINYIPFWQLDEDVMHRYAFGYGVTLDALALVLIACAGIAVATLRWRRMEA